MTSLVVIPPMLQPSRSAPLAQYVPSRACLSCDVCCRFPEADSFLRPYFSAEEVREAIARGVPAEAFPAPEGGQIGLVPNPAGDDYVCPAFDPTTRRCSIYEERPLDCRLYPLAVMWDAAHEQVVLGWDPKCPFLTGPHGTDGPSDELLRYASDVAAELEREPRASGFERNPGLVTRFQEDVAVLRALPEVTARVRAAEQAGWNAPLTPGDRARFEAAALAAVAPEECPSAWAFANHYLWRDLLSYSWRRIGPSFCLFADSVDGRFMPVPPLGATVGRDVLESAFAHMRARSPGRGVARIENVPRPLAEAWSRAGFRVVPRDPEYLYRAEEIAALKGDRYKSQRAACNKLLRHHRVVLDPFENAYLADCRRLYREWREQKQQPGSDAWASSLLEDSEAYHRRLLTDAETVGLTGWVAHVDGRIRGYTFGAALMPGVWCIVAEIADRAVPGLADWMFREGARRAAERGFDVVNTMDATGLPSLARSKQSYRPIQLVQLCTVYES